MFVKFYVRCKKIVWGRFESGTYDVLTLFEFSIRK